jgi:hypothetical protein
MSKAGCEPAVSVHPVVVARSAIPGLPLASRASQGGAPLQALSDGLPSVYQFQQQADAHRWSGGVSSRCAPALVDSAQCKTRRPAPWIECQSHGLDPIAVFDCLDAQVHNSDGKRVQAMDARATSGQQLPRAPFAAGHQRFSAAIEDED